VNSRYALESRQSFAPLVPAARRAGTRGVQLEDRCVCVVEEDPEGADQFGHAGGADVDRPGFRSLPPARIRTASVGRGRSSGEDDAPTVSVSVPYSDASVSAGSTRAARRAGR
jgi:hypothetical protein